MPSWPPRYPTEYPPLRYQTRYHGIWIVCATAGPSLPTIKKKAYRDLPANFVSKVMSDLEKIESRPIGRDLLKLISNRCRGIGTNKGEAGLTCQIFFGEGTLFKDHNPPGHANPAVPSLETGVRGPEDYAAGQKQYRAPVRFMGQGGKVKAGRGVSAFVAYNPNFDYSHYSERFVGVSTPSFVALAHELVHALHILSGDVMQHSDSELEKMIEEARTVGAGKYQNKRISENALRKEHGLPIRLYYSEEGDCDARNLLPDAEDEDF